MTAPAPTAEKAAPIPAEVRKLAEDAIRQHYATSAYDVLRFSYVRSHADTIARAIMQDRADRASQEERIREDERDRLYAEAEMQHAAALLRRDAIAGDVHAGAALWLKECGKGAMLPPERARLRGDAS